MQRPGFIAWGSAAIVVIALAIGAYYRFADSTQETPAGPAEKLTFAVVRQPLSGIVLVAHSRGLFSKHGLDVTLQDHSLGRSSLAAVNEGKADVTATPETPFVFAVLRGEPLKLLATIYGSGTNCVIVARRDRGIAVPSDLAGTRIGLPIGSAAHFMLDTYFTVHRVTEDRIELVNLRAEELVDAVASGRVDAVATFPPYSNQLRRMLGASAVTFDDPGAYSMTFNVVGTAVLVKERPAVMGRLLRALVEAEEFAAAHPNEAREIAAAYLKVDKAEIAQTWERTGFGVSLSQSLLTLLDDQSRWAIDHKLTEATVVPNFLDFIYPDALAAVRRDRVTLIR